jgi:hypothetical protein
VISFPLFPPHALLFLCIWYMADRSKRFRIPGLFHRNGFDGWDTGKESSCNQRSRHACRFRSMKEVGLPATKFSSPPSSISTRSLRSDEEGKNSKPLLRDSIKKYEYYHIRLVLKVQPWRMITGWKDEPFPLKCDGLLLFCSSGDGDIKNKGSGCYIPGRWIRVLVL